MPSPRSDNVCYLRPAHARATRLQTMGAKLVSGAWRTVRLAVFGLGLLLWLAWVPTRMVICALLVLFEPLLRIVLVPLAFLSFLVTLVFGFALDAPNFPRWGMLAFSVGALVLYWLYLGVMSLFMRLPRDSY